MPLHEVVVGAVVRSLFELVRGTVPIDPEKVRVHIDQHLTEVANWSQSIQFFGMPSAKGTEETTLPLAITIPRKFSAKAIEFGEEELLEGGANFLLLGAPGAGKTTTLKRLALRVLSDEPLTPSDTIQCPILLRLRATNPETPLPGLIADCLGIPYIEKEGRSSSVKGRRITADSLLVGDQKLGPLICELLDELQAVVLIDGLDEIHGQTRYSLEQDLENLVLGTAQTKIIVSCRSGDYSTHVSGLDVVELCPLDSAQVRTIADRWLGDADDFMHAATRRPLDELLPRPLFLSQLLTVFENRGHLPTQPSALYKKLIALLLEHWDNSRKISRASRYANEFNSKKRSNFCQHSRMS